MQPAMTPQKPMAVHPTAAATPVSARGPLPARTPATTPSLRRLAVGPGVVLCNDTTLSGEIVIGASSIVHPRVTLNASLAPILIGRNNIFEEKCVIRNTCGAPMQIGDENMFEVNCDIEAAKIGSQNVFEISSRVEKGAVIGSGCVIGVGCVVKEGEVIGDNTVVYGQDGARRVGGVRDTAQASLHARHIEYLREVIPKYNHLRQIQS